VSAIPPILLAEDDPNDRELALIALAEYRVANEVVAVEDGVAVLDFLNRRGPYAGLPDGGPAVILLDLKLPKIDGVEVLRRIKGDQRFRTIPVVILTGSLETRDLDACYRLGANAYVVKPVQFTEFVEAIKGVGLFWALINQPASGPASPTRGS